MQSLILANKRAERKRHNQLMSKVADDFRRSEKMPLTKRYEMSIENMKLQLYNLKLWFAIGRSRSVSGANSPPLSASAYAFTPTLLSETSSDTESSDMSSGTDGMDSGLRSPCDLGIDYETAQLLNSRKAELIGQTIVGRLNIFVPQSGATRYYVNWSNNKSDNVRIAPEVMTASFNLEELRSGMRLQCTIRGLGPDYVQWDKQHPFTNSVRRAPRTHRSRRR